MKIAFFHDHRFYEFNKRYYSEGKLTDKTWARYLDFASELIVVARKTSIGRLSSVENLNETLDDRVRFNCLDSFTIIDRLSPSRIEKHIIEHCSQVDLFVCRLPSFLGSIAHKVALRLGKKVLVELVGCPYDAYRTHGSLPAKFLAPVEAYKLRKLMRNTDHAIYVTKRFLQERYPCNGESISASNVEIPTDRNRISINLEVEKIKFIGSLNSRYKGFEELLLAFKDIIEAYPNIELHVLGGSNSSTYKPLIEKCNLSSRILFFESIKGGAEVLKWLSDGDLYVQPSHTEGLPRALIEAMSIGLPAVATSVGGIPELISEDFLCPPRSPQKLKERILSLIDSFEKRESQSIVNFEKAREYEASYLDELRHKYLRKVLS